MANPKVIILDDKEYSLADLTTDAKTLVSHWRFTSERIEELNNTYALLQRAKNSYLSGLKHEILSDKAGFDFSVD